MSILVIVESAGKIKKINNYLGNDYIVKASYGHIENLDKKTLSIDIENNFNPLYIIPDDKIKVVNELKKLSSKCKEVIIASDNDREGEAIAYSLKNVLKLNNPKRIIFNEITKKAILHAIENPTTINMNMVYSQQTRRILDRLVGYKISPILWNYLENAKSAGRVQSVVVKIINDKEIDINNSISKSYFKTVGIFNELTSILNYNFLNNDDCLNFLKLINKNTQVIINDINNKKAIRNPSPPFITSTLQQESCNKLHFNIKKTMDLAQKLYELGLITYMRTDSPNISIDAINAIKNYIIDKYGSKYSMSKNYESKNSTSQEAHECIRPTNITVENINETNDLNKLYNLIWKRTIASQMTNAEFDIQTIKIDLINNNSILIFNNNQYYFILTNNKIIFDGYLIIYNNMETENDDINNIFIDYNTTLYINKIKITEEYTKFPLRYNESSLVKYLEKNGIGRPSTYVSIIDKIIERKYVEIKNIDGVDKNIKILDLVNFKIKESNKNIKIGSEKSKIIITDMGKIVNDFLITNFNDIMDVEFTKDFEILLDKIALGQGNWVTILKKYYDIFNPIIEKLNNNKLKKSNTDNLLGTINNENIYIGNGKYGPYVKIYKDNKWKYSSIKDIENITLETAYELLEYPKNIGILNEHEIILNKGKYGLYIKYNNINIPVNDNNITYEKAIELLLSHKNNINKTFKKYNKVYNIKKGQYGNYIQIINGTKKENVSIPSKYNIDNITLNDILDIIKSKK
jgi:DNA topoisomerase-1